MQMPFVPQPSKFILVQAREPGNMLDCITPWLVSIGLPCISINDVFIYLCSVSGKENTARGRSRRQQLRQSFSGQVLAEHDWVAKSDFCFDSCRLYHLISDFVFSTVITACVLLCVALLCTCIQELDVIWNYDSCITFCLTYAWQAGAKSTSTANPSICLYWVF